MEKIEIIKDITSRTNGEIYLGVVGAVRTGKSTFIKKVIDLYYEKYIYKNTFTCKAFAFGTFSDFFNTWNIYSFVKAFNRD